MAKHKNRETTGSDTDEKDLIFSANPLEGEFHYTVAEIAELRRVSEGTVRRFSMKGRAGSSSL